MIICAREIGTERAIESTCKLCYSIALMMCHPGGKYVQCLPSKPKWNSYSEAIEFDTLFGEHFEMSQRLNCSNMWFNYEYCTATVMYCYFKLYTPPSAYETFLSTQHRRLFPLHEINMQTSLMSKSRTHPNKKLFIYTHKVKTIFSNDFFSHTNSLSLVLPVSQAFY